MDASATRYAARVSMQSGRQEIVANLKDVRLGGRVVQVGGRAELVLPGGCARRPAKEAHQPACRPATLTPPLRPLLLPPTPALRPLLRPLPALQMVKELMIEFHKVTRGRKPEVRRWDRGRHRARLLNLLSCQTSSCVATAGWVRRAGAWRRAAPPAFLSAPLNAPLLPWLPSSTSSSSAMA